MRPGQDRGLVRRLPLLALLFLPACASSRAAVPLAELRPGATVRVDTRRGPRYQGQLVQVRPDSLHMAIEGSPLAVPRIDLVDMAVERSRWRTGAQIGAGVVGIPAAAALSLLCLISRSDNGQLGDEGKWVDCAFMGGLAGGAAGGLIGALVGSGSRHWLPVRFTPD